VKLITLATFPEKNPTSTSLLEQPATNQLTKNKRACRHETEMLAHMPCLLLPVTQAILGTGIVSYPTPRTRTIFHAASDSHLPSRQAASISASSFLSPTGFALRGRLLPRHLLVWYPLSRSKRFQHALFSTSPKMP